MAYPERKPIYEAYKGIVDKIIEEKRYKSYAESEIEALDQSLLSAFREIRVARLMNKEWPVER